MRTCPYLPSPPTAVPPSRHPTTPSHCSLAPPPPAGLTPDAVVLVATVRALKMHGGGPPVVAGARAEGRGVLERGRGWRVREPVAAPPLSCLPRLKHPSPPLPARHATAPRLHHGERAAGDQGVLQPGARRVAGGAGDCLGKSACAHAHQPPPCPAGPRHPASPRPSIPSGPPHPERHGVRCAGGGGHQPVRQRLGRRAGGRQGGGAGGG
jgi:hypothetical protein